MSRPTPHDRDLAVAIALTVILAIIASATGIAILYGWP